MEVLKAIAFVIFAVSCVVIYKNTNSYEPYKRVIYIVVGTIAMYIVTSVVCGIAVGGIAVKSEKALEDTMLIMKLIYTPINSMIVLGTLGNVFGKLKDHSLETDKIGKRLMIMIVLFIIVLVVESSYLGGFVQDILT